MKKQNIIDFNRIKAIKDGEDYCKFRDEVFGTGIPIPENGTFNWDNLHAEHRLSYYIPKESLAELYQISKSNKSNFDKVNAMKEVLKPLGIFTIGVGTNRAAFQSLYDSRLTFKVALDDVGRRDSPREFVNQYLLRPFCCKIFEVSPCGTVAMVESVYPIKTKEDFSIFFDMIVEGFLVPFIADRYAMDDIGFENFMNYGVREGFGPVLLDFPYLFGYDWDKMKCDTIMEDGSPCGGDINYEVGFMDFVCPNCGKRFRASDIGLPLYDIDEMMKKNLEKNGREEMDFVRVNTNRTLEKEKPIRVKIKVNGVVVDDSADREGNKVDAIRTMPFQKKR